MHRTNVFGSQALTVKLLQEYKIKGIVLKGSVLVSTKKNGKRSIINVTKTWDRYVFLGLSMIHMVSCFKWCVSEAWIIFLTGE